MAKSKTKTQRPATGVLSPRLVRPYPKLRPRTGLRRFGIGIVRWNIIRQRRPRRHARSWGLRTRFLAPEVQLEARATQQVRGSLQERIFYRALTAYGLQPGVDFTFQTNQLGGRMELGGLVADFLFPLPMVIVQVQSAWHTMTLSLERRDDDQNAILQSLGYTVLDIWPNTIEDEAALDYWISHNIMTLWGTSTQGLSLGGGSQDIPYLSILSNLVLERIANNVEAILVVVR
jgi:very-short-patch-repair endonuclease